VADLRLVALPAALAGAWGGEVVDHVAYVVLIDREGKRRVIYDAHVRAAQTLHDLRVLMQAPD